jgi:pyrroline-5-carboxylate reductase
MPNLAASLGAGVTGLYAPTLNTPGRDIVDRLMSAAGDTVWVDSEQGIDFVTAVSGSGPAYFFLLTEALAEAGAALGLDSESAARLARATAAGAGALLSSDPRSPADIRKAVTSPGGTTAAALAVLDGDKKALRALLRDAVAAAARRAGELTE